MAIENPEDLENARLMAHSVASCSDRSGQVSGAVKESENLGVEFLDDWDSYMQDINDRLTILRMVSDSVIKGMVDAVERDSADRIAQKESEISRMKEILLSRDVSAAGNRGVDENCRVRVSGSINLLKTKKEELASLLQELDKLLSAPDTFHVETGEECGNGGGSKVSVHLLRKLSGSHVFSSTLSREANDKHEESIIDMPENIDPSKLVHLSREELVNYFKTEMIKMKRNHESKVQDMTEEYFQLRREYLREQGSSLPLKKDKDVDGLKRKIPEVVSKLEEVLADIDRFPFFSNDVESLSSMKERLDTLLSENSCLNDMLAEKENKVERLSAEVSDAGKEISRYSLAEANLQEVIGNLEYEKEEARIKATICEEVYQCYLKKLPIDICFFGDDLCTEPDSGKSSESEIEDLYMESIISLELSGFIFVQVLKESQENFNCSSSERIYEKVLRASLEQQLLEKVESETIKNQRLEEEMLKLASSVEEKERLAVETGHQLAREKGLLDQATQELERLRAEMRQQGMLITEISKESEMVKSDLAQASEKIEMYKKDTCELKQKLDSAMEELKRKEDETELLLVAAEEKQHILSLAEVNERMYKKQMESVIGVAYGVMQSLADLESKAAVDITKNLLRLDMLGCELTSLTQEARLLKRRGLSYKQRLEKKCLDLKKAETEVDLLGDEVDNLSGLLEKIYIALDHYSPVLKHYPGVMEILKLVKGELSGESTKSA